MVRFTTKPQGMWATFATDCVYCKGEITVTSGRADFHQCAVIVMTTNTTNPKTLADIRKALDNR